jgi:hypothetical protein
MSGTSMVADPASKQAQTALHFEQRFNVAMSRARDRMYRVRSVREEELKPDDLKAKVLSHLRDPMKGRKRSEGDRRRPVRFRLRARRSS